MSTILAQTRFEKKEAIALRLRCPHGHAYPPDTPVVNEWDDRDCPTCTAMRAAGKRLPFTRDGRPAIDPNNPAERRAAAKRSHLWRHYGLTVDDFNALVAKRKGVCEACGMLFGAEGRLNIYRRSERLVALLCSRCFALTGYHAEQLRIIADLIEQQIPADAPILRPGAPKRNPALVTATAKRAARKLERYRAKQE